MNTSEIQWGNPEALAWLMVVLGVALVMVYAGVMRRIAWRRFLGTSLVNSSVNPSRWNRPLRAVCVFGSLAMLVVAMSDLRWGKAWEEIPQRGIEAVFVLDVSRSMLAEDVSPNRLERAKQQIKDMVDEMPGDRVGLVVFAGETRQTLPLTRHVEDFKQTLESVGMHSVRRGGSRLGDAIRVASDAFLDKTTDHKAMVILTDGEDQESDPVAEAKRAYEEQGIRIFTIGLGDMTEGSRIPDVDPELPNRQSGRYVKHKGQTVISKMNGAILKEVATQSDGAYIPAGTKRVDMSDVVHGYIENVDETDLQTAKINTYIPRFQWFLIPAMVLFGLDVLLRGWPSTRSVPVSRHASNAVLVFLLWTLSGVGSVHAQDGLGSSAEWTSVVDRAGREQFNAGVSLYETGELEAAEEHFVETATSPDTSLALRARYNLGNCQYARAIAGMQTEPAGAKESLLVAIESFRSAIQVARSDADGNASSNESTRDVVRRARTNLELALRLKQEMEQQQEDQSAQSEDQSSEDESKPSEGDSSEEQQDQNGEDQSASGDQNESESENDGGESQGDDSQSSSDGEQQDGEQQGGEDAKEGSEEGTQQNGSDPSDGSDEGEQPADESSGEAPEGQLQSQSQDSGETEGQDGQAGAMAQQAMPQSMTREEALKMLQAVRDRDMLRRFGKEQRERSRQIPVERDW
ncbi:BatB [Rhodopirellula islandica]|uniref:BatB n=1 Tax=Rhodopirellula islandica TaxID=595434 RepID=A0A0J1BA92_RHOIS|nr:VWA domain-containing protein [Rhodopirellula islandica]KLU03391.1 BatB [Rhodopirellula islandica]